MQPRHQRLQRHGKCIVIFLDRNVCVNKLFRYLSSKECCQLTTQEKRLFNTTDLGNFLEMYFLSQVLQYCLHTFVSTTNQNKMCCISSSGYLISAPLSSDSFLKCHQSLSVFFLGTELSN